MQGQETSNPLSNTDFELGRKPKILVVEDEADVRQLLVLHLRRQNFDVMDVGTGNEAIQVLQNSTFDLVLFDWMLPDASGIELTKWLRRQSKIEKTPVLFVTAKAEADDIVMGLEAGADDYITKPFDHMILLARVRAQLRRSQWTDPQSDPDAIRYHDLVIFPKKHEVRLSDEKLELTKSEFLLLLAMLTNAGRVLTRKQLAEFIVGESVNVVGRAVDTHVFTLRKKLEKYSDMIETIRGIGYRIRLEAEVNA